MPFLPPNQQCQGTEGSVIRKGIWLSCHSASE